MNENIIISESQYFSIAENLFVREAFSVKKLEDVFNKKISSVTLESWVKEFNWAEKRKKYVSFNRQLIADTQDLVSEALHTAKETPSPNNITSYKRAIEVLMALEKINQIHQEAEEEDEDENEISADKINEFAKMAGLR